MSTLKYVQGVETQVDSFADLPILTRDNAFNSGLPIHRHMSANRTDLKYYSFDQDLSITTNWIMTSMFVPKYFDKMTEEIRGIFLLRIKTESSQFIKGFFRDKSLGKHGCGYKIYTPTEGFFQFNGLTYHPFILRNLAVCYFVCDTGSSFDTSWRSSPHIGVGVQEKIIYDHKLDLFITHDAMLSNI